jgi:hypothetical protein
MGSYFGFLVLLAIIVGVVTVAVIAIFVIDAVF